MPIISKKLPILEAWVDKWEKERKGLPFLRADILRDKLDIHPNTLYNLLNRLAAMGRIEIRNPGGNYICVVKPKPVKEKPVEGLG